MQKKNSAKNIHTASTRIISTHKLPKDFFPRLNKPSKSLQYRRQASQNCEHTQLNDEKKLNGLFFTFYRSKTINLKVRPIDQNQQQKHSKHGQSCPLSPNFEQMFKREDKQNCVLQKRGKLMFKISKKRQNQGVKHQQQIAFQPFKR